MVETIVARSTPGGSGAIAIIRISGDNAFSILAQLTGTPRFQHSASYYKLSVYSIYHPADGAEIDIAMVVRMPSESLPDPIGLICPPSDISWTPVELLTRFLLAQVGLATGTA